MTTRANEACPFCRCQNTPIVLDTEKRRALECRQCGAIQWISKSENSSWWYHGWQQLDTDETPGLRHNGDGKRYAAPISYLRWAELATGGDLSCLNFA